MELRYTVQGWTVSRLGPRRRSRGILDRLAARSEHQGMRLPMSSLSSLPMAICLALSAGRCAAREWSMPPIKLPKRSSHPVVACTPAELARLRRAFRGTGAAHEPVAKVIRKAERIIRKRINIPPRGGQHNQWYQCDKCQVALKTVDDTHHRCPRCQKVYSGKPYDDVLFKNRHWRNLADMTTAAWAYAIARERKYATYAARMLLGYAEKYTRFPYHDNRAREGKKASKSGGHLSEQTLGEAAMMTRRVAPAYDLIHDSSVLSPDDHAKIRAGLLQPMLENIDKHRAGKSNWQTWHNAAMLWGGAALGDVRWVRKALTARGNGFASQMRVSVTRDGMWYENSWGYHFYTLQAMTAIVEGARRLGIDLWSHPALQKMYTLPVHYTMADGSLPRFGDDVNSSARRQTSLMEPAYAAYKAPSILALLSAKTSWDTVLHGRDTRAKAPAPKLASQVFRTAGHAILRTRGGAGLTAALTFGPYGGFHGHLDKLSFVFFGHKRELGVDPGRARSQAYRLPIHRNWYKATLSHNTVIVGKSSQAPAKGKLLRFAANESYAGALVSCDLAYKGVSHARLLLLTPNYLLVVDTLAAQEARRCDWVYHNRGSSVRCRQATQPGGIGKPYKGAEYIQNVRVGKTDKPVRVQFPNGPVTTHLTIAAHAGSTVRVGDGVGASIEDRVAMVMVTHKGKDVQFAAVLEPVKQGASATVTKVVSTRTPTGVEFQIDGRDHKDILRRLRGNHFLLSRDGKVVLDSRKP